jgi:hypothetical protein
MARLFQIIPTIADIRRGHDSVELDDRVMYAIGEDAEQALDAILEPYDGSGCWYLDLMNVKSPGPWAYVALRQEYDIADYVGAHRNKMEASSSFKFTIYDARNIQTNGPVSKVGCFVFFSNNSLSAAAERIRFLRPAWIILRDKPAEQHWLVLLDEEPTDVLREAAFWRRRNTNGGY